MRCARLSAPMASVTIVSIASSDANRAKEVRPSLLASNRMIECYDDRRRREGCRWSCALR